MIALLLSTVAQAGDPHHYALVGAGTTALYVPNHGAMTGPLGDFSPSLAFGWIATPKVSLELDAGVTVAGGDLAVVGVGPAVIYTVNPTLYLAGRLFVPLYAEANLVVLPCVGLTHAFGAWAPYAEVDLATAVGRGEPDLAVAPSLGVSYLF